MRLRLCKNPSSEFLMQQKSWYVRMGISTTTKEFSHGYHTPACPDLLNSFPAVPLFGGFLPFKIKKKRPAHHFDFPIGEAIACGVFLGAGLIHMLGDSTQGFIKAGYS